MATVFRFISLFAVSLLTACATVQPLPKEVVAAAKRIGVVSQVGDTLNKQYVGITVFGNEQDPQNIADWNLDLVYEQQLAAAVKTIFNVDAVLLSDRRAEFSEVNRPSGAYRSLGSEVPNFENVSETGNHVCQALALDAVVLAAKWKSGDFLGGTNQSLEGIGIYARPRRTNAAVHVLFKLGYFDCKSKKFLSIAPVMNVLTPGSDSFGYVIARINGDLAAKPYSQWTPSDKQTLNQTVISLPVDAWTSTLRQMVSPK